MPALARVLGITAPMAMKYAGQRYGWGFGVPTVLGGRIGYVTFGCWPVSDLRKAVIC